MRTNHKIFNVLKPRLISFSAAILFNVSLAAVVCGTFAWYTYATRTGLEKQYHGTTVGDMGSLQAGLISEVRLENYLAYDLAEDDRTLAEEGKLIYWCKEKIEARTINFVLRENGYATTKMMPVTSGAFNFEDENDSFNLYRRPGYLDNYSIDDSTSSAMTGSYSRLNFAFRFEDIDSIGSYLPDYNVFMSGFKIESTHAGREIYKSVRVYFENGYERFLINPTAEEDGFDNVGGILDLNADGFYDFDKYNHEVIYGETESYEFNPEQTAVDGNLAFDERDTFVSNHKQGVYAVNEDTLEPKTASYITMERFTSKAKAITYTNANYHNIGLFDMYIYFEGWDRHLVDAEQGYGYNLDLKFEVQM